MARELMTPRRKQLVRGLQGRGGSIAAEGNEALSPRDVAKAVGLKISTPSAFTAFLKDAEKHGIITRTVNGRRTLSISLTNDYMTATVGSKPSNGSRRVHSTPTIRRPKSGKLPLPPLGTVLTVCMLHQDASGATHVGLRNEDGTWTTSVESHSASELVSAQ